MIKNPKEMTKITRTNVPARDYFVSIDEMQQWCDDNDLDIQIGDKSKILHVYWGEEVWSLCTNTGKWRTESKPKDWRTFSGIFSHVRQFCYDNEIADQKLYFTFW